ncbi:tetratricopeptide repeat protein [Geomonas agri]|uniref:tetratricopeptide repeat protein n=1 Tax=Geomonas agri TaxID=2873702 RepID=UPI001CD3A42E|nr:tetratricopeptide repeat protein [Geomonas agri]
MPNSSSSNDKLFFYFSLALLSALSLALFWPALGHDFLINWDDRQYILENDAIRGLTAEHLKAAFTTFSLGNYAPLHLVSYMIDYEIWGMRPFGFILTNIVLHTLNGLLLYAFLRRLAGERIWIFFASLIFLLHPVQVETVVWAAERKTVLAMSFFLASLSCYREYREGSGGSTRGWYLLSLISFLAALLTKSVVVVMPLVILLFDLCYGGGRCLKKSIVAVVPFMALAAWTVFIALISHSETHGGITTYHGGSPFATFLTMIPVLLSYLRLVFWPTDLSAFYDVPIKSGIDAAVALAAGACAMLIWLGWWLYRQKREHFFWYALFFVGLIPVSQIVPIVTLMNDRYLYFPMLGAAAYLSGTVLPSVTWKEWVGSGRSMLRVLLMAGLIVACAVVSSLRIGVWQDSFTLWGDAVKKAPAVALTHDGFGEGLLQRGLVDEAINQFRTALRLYPPAIKLREGSGPRNDVANTHNNLGAAYGTKGLTDSAIEQFRMAIKLNPQLAKAWFNLGNAQANTGRMNEALLSFETAVRLDPRNKAYQANLKLTRDINSFSEITKQPDQGN